jgi:hypothetical protein
MHDFAQILSPAKDYWSDIAIIWAFPPSSKLRKTKKKKNIVNIKFFLLVS